MHELVLTEIDFLKIKVAIPEIAKVVSAMQTSIASFESILNDPGIQGWLAGTEVGMAIRERVLFNISSLSTLATLYSQFYEKTESAVNRLMAIMKEEAKLIAN